MDDPIAVLERLADTGEEIESFTIKTKRGNGRGSITTTRSASITSARSRQEHCVKGIMNALRCAGNPFGEWLEEMDEEQPGDRNVLITGHRCHRCGHEWRGTKRVRTGTRMLEHSVLND
jgi:hypothetical protein